MSARRRIFRQLIWAGARSLRRTPVAVGFLLLLSVTTGILAIADRAGHDWLLESSSTNLSHLGREPLRVLVASLLWVEPSEFLSTVMPTALLLAAVERRVGSRRALVVFLAGHLGATLLAATGVWAGIRLGTLNPRLADVLDVGISYATFALAAYATGLMSARARLVGVAALLLYLGRGVVADRTFTDFGHLYALAIGFTFAVAGLGLPGRRRLVAALAVVAVLVALAPAAGLVELPPTANSPTVAPRPAATAREHRVSAEPQGHSTARPCLPGRQAPPVQGACGSLGRGLVPAGRGAGSGTPTAACTVTLPCPSTRSRRHS